MLPPAIITALVRFGPFLDDTGVPFVGSVVFTASRPRVWETTGTPVLPRGLVVQLDETGSGEIRLPATDQPGFTDGIGNAVTNWTYKAEVRLSGREDEVRSFALPTDGQTGAVIDLDLLTPVPSSTGVIVALPAVYSVAGESGAIPADTLASRVAPFLPPSGLDDAGVAAKIADPTSATGVAVGDAVGALVAPLARRGNRTVILGDSIAAGFDEPHSVVGSWFSSLCEASGQRLQRLANDGIWGETSAQILARVPDVLARRPDIVILGAVTGNDVTSGSPQTATQARANITAAVDALRAAGVRVILATGAPIDSDPEASARVNLTNRWLERYASTHGIETFDVAAPVTDPADGTLKAGMADDGAHLNTAGREAVVAHLLPRLPGDLTARPLLSNAKGDPTNLIVNGVFVGGTGGYADGWGQNGITSGSLEPRTDGFGNWQVLEAATQGAFLWTQLNDWGVGDVLAVSGEWINETGEAQVEVTFTDGSYTWARPINYRRERFATARTFYQEVVVPQGTTAIYYSVLPGAGRARFGRQTVRNLTRLDI